MIMATDDEVRPPIAVLQPRTFFGLKTGISGNATYVSDDEVLYPVGAVLALHNYTQKRQRFIKLTDKHSVINLLCVSPNKQVLAVAEEGERPSISLYDLTTLKRKRILVPPSDSKARKYVTIAFSSDVKNLMAVTGDPEWTMLCYNSEKGKVESSTKATTLSNTGPVTQVTCNPTDCTVVCIVGIGLFRLLAVSESVWRQYGFQKADLLPISCVCWLTMDRVLAGTRDGRLVMVDAGELKGLYNAKEVTYISLKDAQEPPIPQIPIEDEYDPALEVREITAFIKGFAYTCGTGTVHVFAAESNQEYQKKYKYRIPPPDFPQSSETQLNMIECLSLNVTQTVLLASTRRAQLFTVELWGDGTPLRQVVSPSPSYETYSQLETASMQGSNQETHSAASLTAFGKPFMGERAEQSAMQETSATEMTGRASVKHSVTAVIQQSAAKVTMPDSVKSSATGVTESVSVKPSSVVVIEPPVIGVTELASAKPSGTVVTEPSGTAVTKTSGIAVTDSSATTVTESSATAVTESSATAVTDSSATTVTESSGTAVTESSGTAVTESSGTAVTKASSTVATGSSATGLTERSASELTNSSDEPKLSESAQLFTMKAKESAAVKGASVADPPVILEAYFKLLGEHLHYGPVTGLATCTWKPIFMTCGETDRTVRVWNFESEKQELVKQYQEDIFCVALHPTGTYTTIGFSDKLRFMIILIDDIQTRREFPIRNCRECVFSNSGHMFAAVNGNVVQVYSSISFQNVYNLKGHNGKVRGLAWTRSDHKLVTCGTEGAVYEWETSHGRRVEEVVTKSCVFTGVVVTSHGSTSYGIGSDGEIKEISSSSVVKDVDIINTKLHCVVLSRSDLMMFVGLANGAVLSVRIPLTNPAEFNEYHMHSYPVTRMCMTYDDQNLITVSEDGTVCLWKLALTDGKTIPQDKEFAYSAEIVINKDELEEKIASIQELTRRMQELETEHAYQMRQAEVSYTDRIKNIHEKFFSFIEKRRQHIEMLESDHTLEINKINADIEKMKTNHEQAVQNLEALYNVKLIVEYDKYQLLEEKNQRMKDDYERRLAELEAQKASELEEMSKRYELALGEKKVQLEELQEEGRHQVQQHEEMKRQIEDDADAEILELKNKYEAMVSDGQDANTRQRGEIGVMKKKVISAQKEIDEFKHQIHSLQEEHTKFQDVVIERDRDILSLKKDINERDGTIQDKERRIYDLKRKNQELEKFKFVLNFKIKELKNQLEPKDTEIRQNKIQIQKLEEELEDLQETNKNLELQVTEFKSKLKSTNDELKVEKRRQQRCNATLRQMLFDLDTTSGLVQEPTKLKIAVQQMHTCYNEDKDFATSHEQDVDAQQEFMRQRDHLERKVGSLKRQVFKDPSKMQGDTFQIMQENMKMLEEIASLRAALHTTQKHISDTKALLGLSTKYMTNKKARATVEYAVRSHEDIHNEYKQQIEDLQSGTTVLEQEIQHLALKLNLEHQQEYCQNGEKLRHK